MNNNPIGVFDSGMGGLSVWRELRLRLPGESFVYFGDGANCPYGEKPVDVVVGYIDNAVRILLEHNVKLIVLACNTATMTAVKYLREKYDIPFVGMEPAIKPAVNSTLSGVVGVLATRTTLQSDWFAGLAKRYSDAAKIVSSVGEGFVEAVEAGEEDKLETLELVRRAVSPLVEAGADRIVLGCTHYPFLAGQIMEAAGKCSVEVIDPAPAVARRVESLLDQYWLRAEKGHIAEYSFLSAADSRYVDKLKSKAAEISGLVFI